MRIAVLPSLLAPISDDTCFGGAEFQALALSESLALRGHDVTLVGLPKSGARVTRIFEWRDGTPLLRPGEPAPDNQGRLFARLLDALFEAHPDVEVLHLHLNDVQALEAADEIARTKPVCVIATLHLSAVFPGTTACVQRLVGEKSPLRFTAPSRFARDSYGVGEAIDVVENGVAIEAIPFAPDGPSDGHVVWAGRRSKEKGLLDAVEIARRSKRPLVVLGPSAPEGDLELPAAGVTDLGRLPRSEVPAVLGGAAVTLVPSTIAEAHPLVALESLSAGTPVVGYASGGLREIIEDGRTGFLVEVGDVGAAAAAVERAVELDRQRCRDTARARFDISRMVASFETLYLRLRSNRD